VEETAEMNLADGALELAIDGPAATLTLTRPASRNALNVAMWRGIPELIARAAGDPAVRVVIVQGAGGAFASGADIAEFPRVFAERDAALAYGSLIETATAALADLEKPVIAKIEGYCIGAGLAIALACDLRIAASDARLGAPPAKLGLIYSLNDTRRLVDAVGPSTARAILFTGALLPADEALRLGLVDETHDPADLTAAVAAKAGAIAALSSHSIGRAKALISMISRGQREETDETRGWFADAATSPDFAEGLAAFTARRPPVFP
jgi:enoyl-CoA hydratase/carnithine racemase